MFSVASNKQDSVGVLCCKHRAAHTLAYNTTPCENKLRLKIIIFGVNCLCCIAPKGYYAYRIVPSGWSVYHIVSKWAFFIPHRSKLALCSILYTASFQKGILYTASSQMGILFTASFQKGTFLWGTGGCFTADSSWPRSHATMNNDFLPLVYCRQI